MRSPELSRRGFLGLAALIPALPAILEALGAQELPQAAQHHTGGIITEGSWAPTSPSVGTLHYATGTAILRRYDGNRWVDVGPIRNMVLR